MDLDTLLGLDIARFQEAANDWHAVSTSLKSAADDFEAKVANPLHSGRRWQGEDAAEAAKTCRGIFMDIQAVAAEAEAVKKYLDKMATGDGDGYGNGNLKQAQDKARALVQEAQNHGLSVYSDGSVRWVTMRAPGPLTAEEKQEQQQKQAECDRISSEIKKVLKTAEALDTQLKDALLVIFGTEETFRTENRERLDGDPSFGDYFTQSQMVAVSLFMKAKGWDDAAALLDHFLEGTGKPYKVDADRMLTELPTFQKDVNASLEELKKRPDGPFETDWKSTSSGTEGDEKVMNWYYALHHFEYKMVGEKTGDQITYHVEVRKDYDWGIPSEHRRNLVSPLELVNVEQSEMARLNHTRVAKDFEVFGKTSTMTTR